MSSATFMYVFSAVRDLMLGVGWVVFGLVGGLKDLRNAVKYPS